MNFKKEEQQFLNDVAMHEIRVLMNDGVYRHVRFINPDTTNKYFDLITWPNSLCYTGDMGTFVFSRVIDMFEFFRCNKDGRIIINPYYWSQKIDAVDGLGKCGFEEFDDDSFDKNVREYVLRWIADNWGLTDRHERRELLDAVYDVVIGAASCFNDGMIKQLAAHKFDFYVNDVVGHFTFVDLHEYSFTKYTSRFLWACHAIAWGIRQYDNLKIKDGLL